jgi:methionyl aminopeptidase
MASIDDIMEAEAAVRTGQIKIHRPEAFEGMRAAGKLAAACLDMLTPYVVPGVATGELDRLAREFVLAHDALPACLFYRGYYNTCI